MKFKEYWREILIAAGIYLLLSFAIDLWGEMIFGVPTEETLMSPLAMVIGLLALIIPVFSAVVSAYFIKKKSKSMKDAMLYSAFGLVIASLVMVLISIAMIFMTSEQQLEQELIQLKDLGLGMFEDISLEEFKAFSISMTAFSALFMIVFNFGFGLAGGFIGGIIAKS